MNNKYALMALGLAVLVCAPILICYERKKVSTSEIVTIAVMTALSSAGRIAFAAIPGFKPVTALVIISGVSLGGGAGFMTGALSAVVSNMYFGQGPWTPFQMAVWGIIGLVAGLLGKYIQKSTCLMLVFGAAAGAVYSLLMDICTVLLAGEGFSLKLYLAAVGTSLPFMFIYAVSDVVFLWILGKPMCRKLARLKLKYF
ncbi:MAG: ECF transporter S component [Clostridia bacterium]